MGQKGRSRELGRVTWIHLIPFGSLLSFRSVDQSFIVHVLVSQIVSREASDILSRKFSDLADDPDYDPIEPYVTPFCPRDSIRSRFPFSSHPRLLHDDIDVYPAMYCSKEYLEYLDEDSYITSMTPLRAERLAEINSKTTPSRGFRLYGRPEIHRLRQKYSSSTATLKDKFLHFCGASKAVFSSKYVGLPV
ncbi:hypothetical protein R1flu_007522 [Riccia fluitans]|uniref:Uncharacterized protein n=1 Tax=Riccia fluitans TaxID=41844 RepID=A0ABD1YZA2_9MARC